MDTSAALDSHDTPHLTVTLTGRDRPGVTAGLFTALAEHGIDVLDIEQIVVRDRLVLAAVLGIGESDPGQIVLTLHRISTKLEMNIEIQLGADQEVQNRRFRWRITAMGRPLTAQAVAALADEVAKQGGNIDRIRRVAAYPVTAIVFEGSGGVPTELRPALTATAAEYGVDVAVRRAGLSARGQYLVVMDVDSTLITREVIEMLADHAGAGERVADITERAMRGELDFAESLAERVKLLAGLPESVLDDVRADIVLTPGARTFCRTLKRLGFHIALVSGGFEEIIAPIAAELQVDHLRANNLEVVDGVLTGRVIGPVVDRAGKKAALEEFAAIHGLPLDRTIAIGDGANDIDMLDAAGLGVAFNAKPVVRLAADTTLSVPYLDSVLFLLGITREEIEEADFLE